jgi:hypothetical protein
MMEICLFIRAILRLKRKHKNFFSFFKTHFRITISSERHRAAVSDSKIFKQIDQ